MAKQMEQLGILTEIDMAALQVTVRRMRDGKKRRNLLLSMEQS